jgi:uncharacterized phage protein gp47/JayE
MSVTNKWLSPYQRSYQQIKAKLIEDLKALKDSKGNTLITDVSEGNILVMIISMFAAIAEVIHYYIDTTARETFFSTARKYDSLVKHGALVDYHPHGAVAPTVDVILSRPFTSDQINAKVAISKGLAFTDNSSNTWLVAKDTTWYANTTEVSVPLIQHTLYKDTRIIGTVIPNMKLEGATRRIKLQALSNGNYYEDGTMTLVIGDTTWSLVETFAYSGKFDTHYRVEVDSNQELYIVFGDGVHGKIPDPGYSITNCTYYITKGYNANVLAGQVTNVPTSIQQKVSDAVCSNPYAASGGSDYETFEMLKEHIPLHVRTLGVAITKQDFIDLAMQVAGVNKAAAEYECGRKLNLYITPDNGTTASSTLLTNVYNYLSQRAPLTTWLKVKSTGVTDIMLDIEVTGNKSFSSDEISAQITTALMDKYSIENSEIGGQVRISDIYALIDNLSTVDYLHINKFYLKPWPNTLYGNSSLVISNFVLEKATGSMTYFITFTSSSTYEIRSQANGFVTTGKTGSSQVIDDTENGMTFSLGIQANAYASGYKYSILISEPNKDYVEPGFNLPVFQSSDQLNLTINEVL